MGRNQELDRTVSVIFATEKGHSAVTAQLAVCRGHFTRTRGYLAGALAQLSRTAEIGMAFANATLLRCEPDLVEVLVRLGRHRGSTHAFYRLEGRSAELTSPRLLLAVACNRATLADGEESLRFFTGSWCTVRRATLRHSNGQFSRHSGTVRPAIAPNLPAVSTPFVHPPTQLPDLPVGTAFLGLDLADT
jgi:hypothetical protein